MDDMLHGLSLLGPRIEQPGPQHPGLLDTRSAHVKAWMMDTEIA